MELLARLNVIDESRIVDERNPWVNEDSFACASG